MLRRGRSSAVDTQYMRRAIILAKRAEGMTSPNPVVGAVLVKNGRIISEGYHKRCGGAHAEIEALGRAKSKARGATLYVTLEPCNHFGRTPPCTAAIIRAGVRRVVIGARDPNPITKGSGVRTLRAHHIRVDLGICGEEAAAINRPFKKFVTTKFPYITLKLAASIDGKIAARTGDARWISNGKSRGVVHRLRGKVDAVMVGVRTVEMDDPLLTARPPSARRAMRIVVDSKCRIPQSARLLKTLGEAPLLVATTGRAPACAVNALRRRGAEVITLPSRGMRVDLRALMRLLAARGIMHVMVEGGGELAAGLIDADLVDRILFFIAPIIIGGRDAKTAVEGEGVRRVADAKRFPITAVKRVGGDLLVECERGICLPVS